MLCKTKHQITRPKINTHACVLPQVITKNNQICQDTSTRVAKKSHTSKSSAGVVQLRNRKWTRRFLVAPSTTKVNDPSSVQTPCIPKQAGSLSRPCAFQQPPNIPKPNRVNKNMPICDLQKNRSCPPQKAIKVCRKTLAVLYDLFCL